MPTTIKNAGEVPGIPNHTRLTWFENHNHTPHWKRPGQCEDARAVMEVTSNVERPWLSFDTQEFADRSSKRTMATLSVEDARHLYDWMKSIYEPEASRVLTQLAVEFGFRQCEKGHNLQLALSNATESRIKITTRG